MYASTYMHAHMHTHTKVFLQVMIILTGNYNFFNLLAITMCVSLLDDNFLMGKCKYMYCNSWVEKTKCKTFTSRKSIL